MKSLREQWRKYRSFMREQPLVGGLVYLCLFFGLLLLVALWLPTECGGRSLCDLLGVDKKEAAIRSLSIVLAGLLSVWALRAVHLRAEAMQKNALVAQKNVLATENRLVQERFRDAIGHLGSDKESVRLGGAYALFRLALEEEHFRKPIAEILCSHIIVVTGGKRYREDFADAPSMEIHALMRLLFARHGGTEARSESDRTKFWEGLRADLSGGYFRGLKLTDAQFQDASLAGTQFQGASLAGVKFQGASLEDTQFQGASLAEAQFQGADLDDAQFQGAFLLCAQFQYAFLLCAQFQGAFLLCAQFQSASLAEAQFQGADLDDAQFQGAFLADTQFQGVTSSPDFSSFEQQIQARIDQDADLSNIVFAGGLKQEQMDRWVDDMKEGGRCTEDRIKEFKRRLSEHVGREISHELPDDAEGGHYGKKEADQWIKEYKEAMGMPKEVNDEDKPQNPKDDKNRGK